MNNWIRSAGFACGLAVLPILLPAAQSPSLPPPVDFEPTAAHPRSSEGSFVTLRSGRLMFCYSQFYGG